MKTQSRLFAWLVCHSLATYILMAVSATLFGVLSLDMAHYVSANAEYLLENRWVGVLEGGFAQFIDLWTKILLGTAAYLVFKLCEHALIERVAHYDTPEQ